MLEIGQNGFACFSAFFNSAQSDKHLTFVTYGGGRVSYLVQKTQLSCSYIGDVERDIARNITGIIAPYLLTLANRNDPIYVTSSKVAKASKMSVAVADVFAKNRRQC